MKHAYILLILIIALLQSCGKSNTNQSPDYVISKADSTKISTGFIPPFKDADSVYQSLHTYFDKNETAQDFLNLNYARALIMMGRLEKANTLLKTATSRKGFDPKSIEYARYANLQAAIEAYKQNQEGAINYYKTALQIFEKNNDIVSAASINFNIANIFFGRMDYPTAYQYSLEATKGFEAANDTVYYPSSLAIHAVSAIKLEKREEAIATANQSSKLSERYKSVLGIAMSEYALGEIALYDENYEEAITHFQKGIPLAEQLQQIPVVSASSTSLVMAYLGNENYDLAIAEGKKAIVFAKKYHYKNVLYTLHRYISQAYDKKGDEPLSLEYLRQADEFFRDRVVSNDRRVISELLLQYETEKKEKQIAEQKLKIQKQQSNLLLAVLGGTLLISVLGGAIFYNKRKQQLKLKQIQQEKENAILNSFILGEERERKRISHELHDGVAAMIGAAKMSLESIPHLSQEKRMGTLAKVERILERSHADIRHIAHNLLPTVLEQEGLIQATEQFVYEINETKLVKIHVTDKDSKAEKLSPQLQLILFRVIQELVNNIIKHSQAQNAEIRFGNSPNGLQIEISDDGVGYEDTNGTGHQGLYSITQRLKSIGGNFKITKRKSGGTQAKVVIKV